MLTGLGSAEAFVSGKESDKHTDPNSDSPDEKIAAVSLDQILFPVGRCRLRLLLCPRSPAKTDTHTLTCRHSRGALCCLMSGECEVGCCETQNTVFEVGFVVSLPLQSFLFLSAVKYRAKAKKIGI